jgi:hypothetical protein
MLSVKIVCGMLRSVLPGLAFSVAGFRVVADCGTGSLN